MAQEPGVPRDIPKFQSNFSVILHRTGIPENLGATARAMANLGFEHLIISEPKTSDWEAARKLAVAAVPILENAPVTSTLEEAISLSGSRYLVGTTSRDRKYRDLQEVAQAAPGILQRAATEKAAILFGPEDHGLSNEALTLCHATVTLPTAGEVESFNLSHAVALTLYTLLITASPEPAAAGAPESASFEDVQGMYGHIQELLTETGFLWEDNADHMMMVLREFVNRAEPNSAEVKMIRGICRRFLYHLRNRGS
ncbi:MAG: TrmH family RNA methyltransferase [bacterium]|nr:TrmH family RNA methyltransferase [bacterium]MDT8394828.1 TrmH family RNA methyltransferase [bacterium]